jgi:amino acid adenylation domain-containing protein/non-ribosomal peptide synthase protein (TIGR01720 family)
MKSHDVREMFQQAAQRFAGHAAFRGGSTSVTYAELDGVTDRLASLLTGRGAAKGSAVAILSSRSFDYVAGILAALKAGCLFVPLDPRTPPQRLAAMLEVAAPRCFLLGEGGAEAVAASGFAHVEALALSGRLETGGGAGESPAPRVEIGPDDACYVYFTSGSTGRPKGIAGRYKGIAHYIQWEIEALGIQEGWRVSQLTAPSFDAFLRDLFAPLCAGGTLCAPESREVLLDAESLHDWLASEEVQVVHTVPSLFRTLLSVQPPRPLPALRWVLLAGEPLLPSDVKRWTELYGPPARLVNLYGPSETTMTKLVHFVEPGDAGKRTVPIGKPMPGARALVLDAHGKACPPRGVGEIHIRTPYRSLGYVGREDLTREAFIPNPFNDDPKDLIYKTGDVGRMLEDGTFEFLGRRDNQVKIRGVRLELTEIEDLLLTHEKVREAAVVDREDGNGTRFLCAYVVAGQPFTAAELRDFLARSLPEYALPSVFVPMDSLPRTLSGKVDRRSLPAPEKVRGETSAGFVAPRSGTEEMVAGIFARVLNLPRVGVHESFFDLGGHSLLATQLLSQVRAVFEVEVSLRRLFEAPTIAGLATTVEAALHSGARPPAPPLVPVPRSGPLPLSFAQERLWVLDQLQPGEPLYNVPLAVRFQGALRPEALAWTLAEIGRRHEALRTTFQMTEGRPWQTVSQAPGFLLRWIDLGGLPPERREAEAAAAMAAEAARPFDLTRGPLARVALFKIGEQDHLCLLTMHHIVSDLWSMGVFLREFGSLYQDFSAGRPPSLPALPVQYADFAVWQRSWLAGEALDQQMAYWKDRLAGAGEPLELPLDRPRPAMAGFRGARRRARLGRDLTARLKELAARQGSTLFMVGMAGLLAWLHRVSARRRIHLGVPVANRNRSETEGLIGFFVNTLVLRTDVSGDLAFHDLLARVRESALGAYAHQDLPFEKLVEELRPSRDLARNPLFQVMLAFQNAPLDPLDLPGLKLAPAPVHAGTARFDLTLYLAEEGDRLAVHAEYATELFEAATISRLLHQMEGLLEGAAQEPEQGLRELPLLGAGERQQVLREWNDTAVGTAAGGYLHAPFADWVGAQPHAPAVLWEGGSLSYRELNRRANHLAHRLRGLGVRGDAPVGLCVERSAAMIVGLLGILKAGGAYLPLDPTYPEERLRFLLEDSRAAVLLAPRELTGRVPAGRAAVIHLEDLDAPEAALDPRWDAPPPGPILPEHAAYVIYTSGSTGRPKGVIVSHRAICNRLSWMQETYRLSPDDRVLQKTPFSFDVSVWELFWPLLAGARLVLARPEGHRDPAYLLRRIREERISVVHFVPPMLQVFLEERGLAEAASLRLVVCSGEALGADLQERFFARLGAQLHNLYGPTEAAVDVTFWACARDARGPVPIGRPIANTQIRVLDPWMQPAPVGVPGELYLGGVNLARGYLERPALTAERFLPDPLGEETGGRLYRTGDLARHRPDGAVEFLGRIDHQVKIRGFRIEPGEIEAVLAGHAGVRESRVVVRGEGEDRHLVAYVVPVEGAAPEPAALRSWARRELPDAMVPASFVFLAALPLTLHGKVDLRALGLIAPTESGRAVQAFVEPRGRTEELLAGIWAEVLGLERIGAHADFFAAGGHSLLGVQVVSRVREVFGIELSLRDLFETPVLSALAQRVEEAGSARRGARAPRIERVSRQGELPLSFGQQRLWFLAQLEPLNPAYNVPAAFRLEGELWPAALRSALSEIVRRHEVLRTAFAAGDGRPWLRVTAPGTSEMLELPQVDLGALPAPRRADEARRLASEEARRPFDLEQGPLLRVTLVRLAPADHLTLATLHHIASDGWSWPILLREMAALYTAASAGEPSPLPELAVQYADFAHWQRSWLRGPVLAAELDHWRGRLRGAPALLDLPLDQPRPAARSWRGATTSLTLPEELARALSRVSRREGATLFMTLLAAFQALLRRHGAQERVPVGTPVAGRNRLEIEPLIGFFVNTLVLSADLGDDPTFRELLARVREAVIEADAHQDLPFEKLVEELEPERSLSHTPLFQVMLAFQATPPPPPDLGGLRVTALGSETGTAKFDLTLLARQQGERIGLELEHATELFTRATAVRLLERLERLLAGAAAEPGRRLSELPLLGPGELHQVLYGWNETAAPEPATVCVHRLFERQAARTPQAIALEGAAERLTYAELDRRAGLLARRLRARGVGPEVPVGLCIERSPDMVVGALAILKAGGAYLPLDPAYPRERLQLLLADSRAPVLLTRGALLPALAPASAEPVLVDDAEEVQGGWEDGEPDLESLAYVLYTSGSTGRPKGVMVSHRGLLHYLGWSSRAYLGGGSGAPLLSPLGFDLTVTSLFTPLLAGQPLVLLPEGEGPDDLADSLRGRRGFAFVKLTPAHLEVLEHGLPAEARAGLAGALVLGGEALPAQSLAAWRACAPSLRLINEYGPTEAVVGCCVYEVPPGRLPEGQIPIGRPIPGTRLYVLDERLAPFPAGVAGELYIGGDGLARGYLDRPALTAERFVPDPFGDRPGGRLYRTGDLVRHRPDGNLEFLGRVDHQVKVRGFRIEPGEIEAALLRCAGVREAVVAAREDAPGSRRLVAYVVSDVMSEPGAPAPQARLRETLQASLPAHMIPAAFVALDALPLTANGKVDRRALPAPATARPDLPGEHAAPETAAERRLAAIWSEVLRVEPVGLHDNFFQLGGDSILSIQVVSRASRAGLHITARQIFEHQTIAALAAVARVTPRAAGRTAVTGEVPLTPVQRWFFAAEPADPHHYNQSVLLEAQADLDERLLRRAVTHLLHHHDALRFRFERGETGWRQIGGRPAGEPPVAGVDLGALPAAHRPAALTAAAAGLQASLDLGQGPLLRIALFRCGSGQPAKLLLAAHHLVVDGVSWRILLEDLETAYGQLAGGAAVELPPATSSYGEWAWRLAEHAASGRVDHELAFWTAPQRARAARLPRDGGGENTVQTEGRVTVALAATETAALLKEVPQAYRTQINDVLLTALVQSFAEWSGERGLLVDLEGHGREEILEDLDLSRTVGWFTSIFPVLLNLQDAGDPGEALVAIKEQLRAVPERGIGYGLLRYLAGPEAAEHLGNLPAAEVSFNYLGQLDAALSATGPFRPAGDPTGPLRSARQRRRYPIEVTALIFGGQLQTSFAYSRSLHRPATVECLADGFLRALRDLIEHCLSPWARAVTPSDFPLASLSREALANVIGQVGQAKV